MSIAHVSVQSNRTKRYKSYNLDFKSQGHYDNWWAKVSKHGKVISVVWEDINGVKYE